jgi:hypothetical protein
MKDFMKNLIKEVFLLISKNKTIRSDPNTFKMKSKCSLTPATYPVTLFFIVLAVLFGFVGLWFFLDNENMIPVDCQSVKINVTLELCYIETGIFIQVIPWTGRVEFCFPVLRWFAANEIRNVTVCHWKKIKCGDTYDQLNNELNQRYPLNDYTPCWYWNDTNAKLSYYPLYLKNIYADSKTLLILASVFIGTASISFVSFAIYSCMKR